MLVLTNHLLKSTAFAFNQRSMPTTQSDPSPPRPLLPKRLFLNYCLLLSIVIVYNTVRVNLPLLRPLPEGSSSLIYCLCLTLSG